MRISASNCIEHRESLVLKLHTSISHIHERNRDRVNANVNLFPIKFSFHETFWCENLLFIALIFYWSIHESNAKVVGCERCALTHVEIQVLFNGVIFFLIPRKALSVFFAYCSQITYERNFGLLYQRWEMKQLHAHRKLCCHPFNGIYQNAK